MMVVRLSVLWILLASLPARASIVLHYDLETLASASDSVVYGRVVDQQSFWDGRVIITEITLEVLDGLKGPHAAGDVVVVRQQGGVVGDLAMWVPGMPSFVLGEEVVVFLEDSPARVGSLVTGLAQGKFGVVADPESGDAMVVRDLTGLSRVDREGRLVDPSAAGSGHVAGALESLVAADPMTLSLADQVRLGPVRMPIEPFFVELRQAIEVAP